MTDRPYLLSATSELTQHALQADLLDAEHPFVALQNGSGGAMLFFIGSGDVLCLGNEEPGSEYGWQRNDLSSAQTRRDFPWGASCKRFTAVQARTGGIDLAMVLCDGSDDHLYLSLGNSEIDTSWIEDPPWLACPFNATFSSPPSTLEIVNVMISDASDRYVIALDIVANPGEAVQRLRRYYLDLSTPQHPEWVPHSVGAGLGVAGHVSCLGRVAHAGAAEGVYSMGFFGGNRRLLYTEVSSQDAAAAAPATALQLPGALLVNAIAACRHADNTTDLYVAARGALYYFGAGQHDLHAQLLLEGSLFENVDQLYACQAGGRIVLWGLNGAGQAFYATCAQGQAGSAASWSRPLCMLSGVRAMSPFIDRVHGALVLLARTAEGIVKLAKSPLTGLWNRRSLALPPSSLMQETLRKSAYVTCIRISEASGKPAAHVAVQLCASSVTSVQVNGLYRIVGPMPISVPADANGALSIIDTVDGLAGARFEASVGGCSVAVNPMDEAFKAASAMVQDGGLARAYQALDNMPPRNDGVAPAAPVGYPHAMHSDVGDLFGWLDSGIGGSVQIVHDHDTGLWHLVAHIGGQFYHGALDCVEKIVAATLWMLSSVKSSGAPAADVFIPPARASLARPVLH